MISLLQKLLRRTTIVAVLILIQVGILVATIVNLSTHYVYVYAVFTLISVAVALWIVSRQDNPSYKLAWLLMVLGFPIFGGLFYLMFGGHRVSKKLLRKLQQGYSISDGQLDQTPEPVDFMEKDDPGVVRQSQYILSHSGYPAWQDTKVGYFPLGEDKFEALLQDLRRAEHYIFLEYFIIEPGKMWNSILEILEEKAAQGLDVRVMYDDIGSGYTLPDYYERTLRKKNIKCFVFNPFRPVMSVLLNNRDHRKIVVIDGYIGYTGGVNLADEYINEVDRFGHWKDTAVRLEGEAVWNLTVMFLQMWDSLEGIKSKYECYRPHVWHPEPFAGQGVVQPYGDSPLDEEAVGENVYLNIIGRARKYVWITTPYLIIDNEMVTALCLAAKSGVDVRIITPGKPDKWYVHMVTQGNYAQLVQAGVKIWEYTPGFIHAKSFVCDDCVATVGTINLDYRSLYLHFECGVWMYRTPCIADIRRDYLATLEQCTPIPCDYGKDMPFYKRLIRAVLRLVAPLM